MNEESKRERIRGEMKDSSMGTRRGK
jgi:hypothetical protein